MALKMEWTAESLDRYDRSDKTTATLAADDDLSLGHLHLSSEYQAASVLLTATELRELAMMATKLADDIEGRKA